MNDKSIRTILCVETATRGASLAIWRDGELRAEWRGATDFTASSDLLPRVADILRETEITLREVDLLAAVNGPGSFNGLRVGLAMIKGFAAALQIPTVGVPTLTAVAAALDSRARSLIIFPAGRDEYFWQIFESDENKRTELQNGKIALLEQYLLDRTDLQIIAPLELHAPLEPLVRKFNFPLQQSPPNIAIGVGRLILRQIAASSLDFDENLQINYGRDVQIIRK